MNQQHPIIDMHKEELRRLQKELEANRDKKILQGSSVDTSGGSEFLMGISGAIAVGLVMFAVTVLSRMILK